MQTCEQVLGANTVGNTAWMAKGYGSSGWIVARSFGVYVPRADAGQSRCIRPTALRLGQVRMSRGVKSGATALRAVRVALKRHRARDWGEVLPKYAGMNEQALKQGERVLSVHTLEGQRLYVITEGDGSATTVMLPNEYRGQQCSAGRRSVARSVASWLEVRAGIGVESWVAIVAMRIRGTIL